MSAPRPSRRIYRRTSLFASLDGRFIPSLGLAPLLLDIPPRGLLAGPPPPRFEIHSRRRERLTLLRFRGPSQTHQTVSAKAVIQSELKMEAGENR